MSGFEWVPFRNAVEATFDPVLKEANNFATALKTEAEAAGGKDLAASFVAGYTAFAAATGTFEVKAIAAVTAFAAALLGYAVTIAKAAENDVTTTPPTA